jgi:hypothetical protein
MKDTSRIRPGCVTSGAAWSSGHVAFSEIDWRVVHQRAHAGSSGRRNPRSGDAAKITRRLAPMSLVAPSQGCFGTEIRVIPSREMARRSPSIALAKLRAWLDRAHGGYRLQQLTLSFGVPVLDVALPRGGLALGCLHEVIEARRRWGGGDFYG